MVLNCLLPSTTNIGAFWNAIDFLTAAAAAAAGERQTVDKSNDMVVITVCVKNKHCA